MGMREPAGSRGGYSFDLPQPTSQEADHAGRWPAKAWQPGGSWTRRCLGKPGGPACLLSRGGRGVAGGGEAPGDCADTGRKLASKFYQLSAEEVGAGTGLEDRGWTWWERPGPACRCVCRRGHPFPPPGAASHLVHPSASAGPKAAPLQAPSGSAADGWGRGRGAEEVKVKASRSRLGNRPHPLPPAFLPSVCL